MTCDYLKRKKRRRTEKYGKPITPQVDQDRVICSTAKFCYRNRKIARRAVRWAVSYYQEPTFSEYRCAKCGWWHIGRRRTL